jgi:hypothetical protein
MIVCSSKYWFSFLLSSAFPSSHPQVLCTFVLSIPRFFRHSFISLAHHVSFYSPFPSVWRASPPSPPTLACATTSIVPLIQRLSYPIFFLLGLIIFGLHPEDGRCKLLRNSIACILIYMVSYPEDFGISIPFVCT